MIEIKKYTAQDQPVWDAFVAASKNATFLFSRGFMEYHKERFQDFSLLIFEDSKLIALLPANFVGDTLYSHQGLTYGGLLVSQSLKTQTYVIVFEALLHYLTSQGIASFVLKKLPSFYEKAPSEEIEYLLFLLSAELIRRDVSSVIEGSTSIPFSKIRKRGVKKAQNLELRIVEENDFNSFWEQVLIPNLKAKHGVGPVHTLEEIQLLKAKFPKNIRQFAVYRENKILAGTTIFETENVAHAQYISAIQQADNFGSLDLLFHHLITEVFQHKKYIDFGISNENNGLQLNKGLLSWKEGFGARTKTYDVYEIDPSNVNLLTNLFV